MTVGPTCNIVAIVHSEEMGTSLNEVSAKMNGTRLNVHVGALRDVRPDVDIFESVDVFLLEVDPRDPNEMTSLESIVQKRFPGVPVLATASEATLQDVRQFMRMGVLDVIPQPITQDDLSNAIDYAMRSKSKGEGGQDGRGQVISFLKAGGGVGATTLAVQTAHLLAKRSKTEEATVCLLDMDVQHGNAALYLDVDNSVGVMDLVDSAERLDPSLLEGIMIRHDTGVEVLAAPRDMVPLDIITPDIVDTCLTVCRAMYPYVLVDLPGVWTDWSLRILQRSQMIVVVAQLTVPHIRRTRRLLDTLVANRLDNVPIKVLVNRFEKGWGKSINLAAASKALGRPVDFYVMNDYRTVSEAIDQGVSLSEITSRTKVEKSLRQFIDTATGELSEGDERAEPRLKIGFGG